MPGHTAVLCLNGRFSSVRMLLNWGTKRERKENIDPLKLEHFDSFVTQHWPPKYYANYELI